jgi:hypothetical protein
LVIEKWWLIKLILLILLLLGVNFDKSIFILFKFFLDFFNLVGNLFRRNYLTRTYFRVQLKNILWFFIIFIIFSLVFKNSVLINLRDIIIIGVDFIFRRGQIIFKRTFEILENVFYFFNLRGKIHREFFTILIFLNIFSRWFFIVWIYIFDIFIIIMIALEFKASKTFNNRVSFFFTLIS